MHHRHVAWERWFAWYPVRMFGRWYWLEDVGRDQYANKPARYRYARFKHDGHASDCALHNGPAFRPRWCDCEGFGRKPSNGQKLRDWITAQIEYFTNR